MSPSVPAASSDLRRAFDVIDADRDGLISREDLLSFFSAAYHDDDDDMIGAMISVADSDGDGRVEFSEFERMMVGETGGGKRRGKNDGGAGAMEEAFRLMDSDGDGGISHGDLKSFLASSGFEASDEDVSAMMRLAAGNIDLVSFDEFLRVLPVDQLP